MQTMRPVRGAMRLLCLILVVLCNLALNACGYGPASSAKGAANGGVNGPTVTISGTVSGLPAQQQLTLRNSINPATTTITGNGNTRFFSIGVNTSYAIAASSTPPNTVCTVLNGFGAVASSNVTNIKVICSATSAAVSVSGSVSGLFANANLSLVNNGDIANAYSISANGPFTLAQKIATASGYTITVSQQPTGQICSVTNGNGIGNTTNVGNVVVVCSSAASALSLSGRVTGLIGQLTLSNGTELMVIRANGTFNFSQKVALNGGYSVAINQQPASQNCTLSNGSGSGVTAAVTNIAITCAAASPSGGRVSGLPATQFTVGGNVNGLAGGTQVTVINSNDPTNFYIASVNGVFTLPNAIAKNSGYSLSVSNVSGTQNCSITNGNISAGIGANVTNVEVNCASPGTSYTIGGSVSGLPASTQVTLIANGDIASADTVSANGAYQFPNLFASNTLVDVSVLEQPAGASCVVSNPVNPALRLTSNTTYTANVICGATNYPVTVAVSGMPATGATLTLTNNGDGNDALPVSANGSYTFVQPAVFGGSEAVLAVATSGGIACGAGPAGTTNSAPTVNVNCTGVNGTFVSTASGFASASSASLQQTYGSGLPGSADGARTSASMTSAQMLATDGVNIYFTDSGANNVRMINIATGTFSTVAGSGAQGSINGVGTAASFNAPTGITTDGNYLYVGDAGNCTIRRIEIATKTVTTIAGTAGTCAILDGTGAQANFAANGLSSLVLSADGSTLYVADTTAIRALALSTGVVSTVAGQTTLSAASDGVGTSASFGSDISGMTSDGTNLYVATYSNVQSLRSVDIASMAVSTLAVGSSQSVNGFAYNSNGSAALNQVQGLTTDSTYLYFTNGADNNIFRIHTDGSDQGTPATLTGASSIHLNGPIGLVTDGQFAYICNSGDMQIIQVSTP